MAKYLKHYKGNYYKVLGKARNSETLEEMIVYQAGYGDNEVWVRPAYMFDEMVETSDGYVKRFTEVSEEEFYNNCSQTHNSIVEFINKQKPLDRDISKFVDENFWSLI